MHSFLLKVFGAMSISLAPARATGTLKSRSTATQGDHAENNPDRKSLSEVRAEEKTSNKRKRSKAKKTGAASQSRFSQK